VRTFRFRVAEAWEDDEKGTNWATWGLDWGPSLRSSDVQGLMTRVRPALQCTRFSPSPREVRVQVQTTATAEHRIGWITLPGSVKTHKRRYLPVSQRSQITDVEPTVNAKDIIIIIIIIIIITERVLLKCR